MLLYTTLLCATAHAFLVPEPPGPYNVAVEHLDLTDTSRIDPFAPEPNTTRRIMASVYLPVDAKYHCKPQIVPYLPDVTASVFGEVAHNLTGLPEDMFKGIQMEFCDLSSVNTTADSRKRQFPVAIFSPGYSGSRLLYGAYVRSLSSLGYVVVTIDPTYEAGVVVFSDGTAAYAQPSAASDPKLTPLELAVRTADMSFVISQLSNSTLMAPVLAHFPGTFNPHKVVTYGHSFGGSTAAQVALEDSRVIGGANLDGLAYGSVGEKGITGKPFVLVSNGAQDIVNFEDFYKKIHGPKLDLLIKHTHHYAFLDIPLLLSQMDVPPEVKPAVEEIIGTLDGRKVEKAIDQIVSGLVDFAFYDKDKGLKSLRRNCDLRILHSNI